jgi:nickel-dependent lactate racemase
MQLKYGSSSIDVPLPGKELIGVLAGREMKPLAEPAEKIAAALRDPIGSEPLSRRVKKGEKVAIVVSDRTRSTKADLFLPILIDELNSQGIPDNDILIVFSLGTHNKHTREQQEKIVGKEIASRVRLIDHDCRDEANLVYLGKTSRGTPVKLNKIVVEAERKILTSGITYHYFAGFGGGRKAVLPGIAGFESIQANHRMSMDPCRCTTAALDGNPLSEDMEEAARMLKPDFIVNTVLNEKRELCGVFAGDPVAAHRAGCKFINDHAMVKIGRKAELVIASAGGGSMDLNFVQSHKAMENAHFALKEGGVMILLAESSEGFPSDIYMKYIEIGSAEKIHAELIRNFTIPGHTVYAAFQKAEEFKIIWVSRLPKEVVRKMGITPADSFEEARALAQKWLSPEPPTYIMPLAYTTFPAHEG